MRRPAIADGAIDLSAMAPLFTDGRRSGKLARPRPGCLSGIHAICNAAVFCPTLYQLTKTFFPDSLLLIQTEPEYAELTARFVGLG